MRNEKRNVSDPFDTCDFRAPMQINLSLAHLIHLIHLILCEADSHGWH